MPFCKLLYVSLISLQKWHHNRTIFIRLSIVLPLPFSTEKYGVLVFFKILPPSFSYQSRQGLLISFSCSHKSPICQCFPGKEAIDSSQWLRGLLGPVPRADSGLSPRLEGRWGWRWASSLLSLRGPNSASRRYTQNHTVTLPALSKGFAERQLGWWPDLRASRALVPPSPTLPPWVLSPLHPWVLVSSSTTDCVDNTRNFQTVLQAVLRPCEHVPRTFSRKVENRNM